MFFLTLMALISNIGYNVVWNDLDVYIPLNEEVTPYTLIPSVFVYYNNEKLENLDIYYHRGVERTFLSVVNSRDVKTFYIKYRVYIPSIGVDEIATVAFHIVDTIKPTIQIQSGISFAFGQKIELLQHIEVKDNYDASTDIKIILDTSNLNIHRVGIYQVLVKAIDTSGNESQMRMDVEIYDKIAPEITFVKPIIIEPHTEILIHQFIKVKDNVDSFIKVSIDDTFVLYDTLGVYPIFIYAQDQSLNQTSISYEVEIKDTLNPELILVSQTQVIQIHETVTEELLRSYVISMTDNFDLSPVLDIKEEINPFKIGVYNIYYTLTDQSGNSTEKTLKIHVVDQIAPTVTSRLDRLSFEVFQELKPLITYFDIRDNYDTFESIQITIKDDININKIGTYELTIDVIDTSKNKKTYRFFVDIMDTTAPTLDLMETIIITTFQRPEYQTLLVYRDQYDSKQSLTLLVFDEAINYLEMGKHTLQIFISDTSNNTSTFDIEILIIDTIPPEIILSLEVLYIDIEQFSFNPMTYILRVDDNREDINNEQVHMSHEVIPQIGFYEVLYEVYDSSGLYGFKVLSVYVIDSTKPVVKSQNLSFQSNDQIDVLAGIEVSDHSQTKIIVLNEFQMTKNGVQTLYYVVYDTFGNETFFSRTITLEDTRIIARVSPYIQSISTLSVGSIFAFIMWYYFTKVDFDKKPYFKYNKTMTED